jgi:hypothetical protein
LQDSNKKIIETLEVNSEVLDNIHEGFTAIVHESNIKVHSFQEARGISGMKGLDNKVNRQSALTLYALAALLMYQWDAGGRRLLFKA